jgi:hypothetical protein
MLMSFIEAIAVSSSMIFLSKVFSDILLAVFSLFYIYLLVDVSKLVDKKILIALSLFFSLSLGISLLNLDSRIFVYLLLTANLSLVSNYYMPYRVTTSIFGDIKELVLDYVLIVDDSCQIIYKNNNIANSHVFKDIEKVDIQEIGSIFRDSTIIRKAYDKSFIKVLKLDMYFQYNKKEIMDGEKIAGHIITFTDISDLIHMLDSLKIKQEEAKAANIKLALYKEIVYDTEKDREINSLLEEIANNQQQSMENLKLEIENLRDNMDSDFSKNIQKTIEKAKSNLLDVRTAVTEYTNFYYK